MPLFRITLTLYLLKSPLSRGERPQLIFLVFFAFATTYVRCCFHSVRGLQGFLWKKCRQAMG